jgi:predicted ATPase
MIRLIETQNFGCLRYVCQPLAPFHVLVGPNASGKTTFLDVVAFLGRLVSDGVEAAVDERTANFSDLVWGRQGEVFELAIEAVIPEDRRQQLAKSFEAIRYEVRVGLDSETRELGILEEKAWLTKQPVRATRQRSLFPCEPTVPATILTGKAKSGWQRILTKAHGGNDNFYVEVRQEGAGKGWFPSIRLGPRKSALGNLPEDESRFPVATWFRALLARGVQKLVLNSLLIRKASPPGQMRGFRPDGSNLPWVIAELERPAHRERLARWVAHVQSALPDIESLRTVERPEDKHRYLMIRYRGGLEIPSWMASDGTLRLLALTVPAYLPKFEGVYLIEEPENGIHPQAVETVYQSLCSVYEAQILLATHSPVILSMADAKDVLCFKKTAEGASDIVRGDEHPELRTWRGQPNLSILFASGVLG